MLQVDGIMAEFFLEYDEFLENSAKEEHKPRNSLLLMKVLRLISIDDEIEQENEKVGHVFCHLIECFKVTDA